MAKLFSIRPGLTLRGRKFRGVRGWAGKPSHPPLTDFPIVAYILAAAFDLISRLSADSGSAGAKSGVAHDFFVAATYVIVAGAVVSLATAVTGFWDWWKGLDRDHSTGPIGKAKHTQVWRTVNTHATIMVTVTLLVVVDIVLRIAQFDDGFTKLPVLMLSIVAAVLVGVGGVYGGSLVYDYQFNVEGLDGSTAWDESETDQLPGDKPAAQW
jgi:uncharacterized membrane protein